MGGAAPAAATKRNLRPARRQRGQPAEPHRCALREKPPSDGFQHDAPKMPAITAAGHAGGCWGEPAWNPTARNGDFTGLPTRTCLKGNPLPLVVNAGSLRNPAEML